MRLAGQWCHTQAVEVPVDLQNLSDTRQSQEENHRARGNSHQRTSRLGELGEGVAQAGDDHFCQRGDQRGWGADPVMIAVITEANMPNALTYWESMPIMKSMKKKLKPRDMQWMPDQILKKIKHKEVCMEFFFVLFLSNCFKRSNKGLWPSLTTSATGFL